MKFCCSAPKLIPTYYYHLQFEVPTPKTTTSTYPSQGPTQSPFSRPLPFAQTPPTPPAKKGASGISPLTNSPTCFA